MTDRVCDTYWRTYRVIVPSLLLVALALVTGAQAEDLKVEENPVPGDSFAVVSYPLADGDQVKWEISPKPAKIKTGVDEVRDSNGKVTSRVAFAHFNGPSDRRYEVVLDVINFKVEKWDRRRVTVEIGKAPQPPPAPPDVDPKPPGPPPNPPSPPPVPPAPAKSFYVVLVKESGKTLTKEQNALFHGVVVEKWLQEKTTRDGEFYGFRRHDPDDANISDTETMNALWGKVKSAITPTTLLPAVAIARDGNVTIEPLSKVDAAGNRTTLTPAELTTLLDKYLQGK